MSKKQNQHVVPHGGQWAVKGEGNEKATVVLPTQKEAIEVAHEISFNKGSEMFIHRRDGTIREGIDPTKK